MVFTNGNEIVDAYTNGVQVIEIYSNGMKVWPTTPSPANDEIFYMTYSGDPITLYDDTGFGVNLVSNTYDSTNGVYVLKFDGTVSKTGKDSFKGISDLRTVYLPLTATVIGFRSFFSSGLDSIEMPSIVTIEGEAFHGCNNLISIILPSTCTTLYGVGFGGCFSDCTSLTDVIIPASCVEEGPGTFQGCTNLSNVIVYATTPPLMRSSSITGNYAEFRNCSPNLQIKVPASSLNAYQTATGWSDYASQIVAQS